MNSNDRGRAHARWLGDLRSSSGRLVIPALHNDPIKFISKYQDKIPLGYVNRDDLLASGIAIDFLITLVQLLEDDGFDVKNVGISVEIGRDKSDSLLEIRVSVSADLPGLGSKQLLNYSEEAKKNSQYCQALRGVLIKVSIDVVEFKLNKRSLNFREFLNHVSSRYGWRFFWSKKRVILVSSIIIALLASGQIRSGSDLVDTLVSTGNSVKYSVFKVNPVLSAQEEIRHVKTVCKTKNTYTLKDITRLDPETCVYFEILTWNIRRSNLLDLVLYRNCINILPADKKQSLGFEATCAKKNL